MERKDDSNRMLINSHTGIDLCVSTVKEVEAPLGGTSVEYEVTVVSDLKLLRTNNCSNDHVVQYSVLKTYREFEDLVNKLRKHYQQCKFLALPKSQISVEEKRSECDRVLKQIAANSDLMQSSVVLQFIGVDPKTNELTIDIKPPNEQEEIVTEDASPGSDEKEDFDLFEELVNKEKAKNKTPSKTLQENLPKEVFVPDNQTSEELLLTKNVPAAKTIMRDGDLFNVGLFAGDHRRVNISLFEDQDYGDVLTKEEEQLFFVPEKQSSEEKVASNTESKEENEDIFRVDDDLGDLLKISNQPARKEPISNQELKQMVDTKQPPASHNQQSSFSVMANSSQVKAENQKPPPPPKPKSLAKPVPPPKPKPKTSSSSSPTIKQDVTDSGELDIFKYIEQEEKASTQEASLFD